MGSKNVKPSEVTMPSDIFPEVLQDMTGDTGTFEKAVARAEQLGKAARQAAPNAGVSAIRGRQTATPSRSA